MGDDKVVEGPLSGKLTEACFTTQTNNVAVCIALGQLYAKVDHYKYFQTFPKLFPVEIHFRWRLRFQKKKKAEWVSSKICNHSFRLVQNGRLGPLLPHSRGKKISNMPWVALTDL